MGRGTAIYGPQRSTFCLLDRSASRSLWFEEEGVSAATTGWAAPNDEVLARNELASERPRNLETEVEPRDVGQLWRLLSEDDKERFSTYFSRMVMKLFEGFSKVETS